MKNIDFYYLRSDCSRHTNHVLLFTCRLLEKAYYKNHEIFVMVENSSQAETLDSLLWTFRDTSFIPHSVIIPNQISKSPILITSQTDIPTPHNDILLNLTANIPQTAKNFSRILEIFTEQDIIEGHDRQHHDYYQAQGYFIKKHDIL